MNKMPFGIVIRPAGAHPSFHNVIRNIPHYGPRFEYIGFMDDFGFLVKADFQKLAIVLRYGVGCF